MTQVQESTARDHSARVDASLIVSEQPQGGLTIEHLPNIIVPFLPCFSSCTSAVKLIFLFRDCRNLTASYLSNLSSIC